ncbi:hypothetical protein GCHA_1421 [Paraglaciecola chathamensis S18K6]|uniref:Uncharacterized protein n=1 Tax=Paraglaciecola chathamensis S18K6 TaxID=1127672 RepID=A0AAV3UWC1_9ALTE|nr:hypothetical protein GCHA_1421 [Paraglaciecola chathamensis S18K6]
MYSKVTATLQMVASNANVTKHRYLRVNYSYPDTHILPSSLR